jgi:hypothetical protein
VPLPVPAPSKVPEPAPVPVPLPQPAPAITPQPEPSKAPEPVPVVTPEPSPAITPQPEPSRAPEPTPAVSPIPAPSSVTPEPAPFVVPQPAPSSVAPEPVPIVPVPQPQPAAITVPDFMFDLLDDKKNLMRAGAPVLLTAANDSLIVYPSGFINSREIADPTIWQFVFASRSWKQLDQNFTDTICGWSQGSPAPSANPLYIYSQTQKNSTQFLHVSSVDPTTHTLTRVANSSMLPCTGVSTAVISDRFFIFGGQDPVQANVVKNDIFVYKKGSMNISLEVPLNSSNRPVARAYAAMVGYGNGFFMHGGITANATILSDLWFYDSDKKAWNFIVNAVPVAFHRAVISYLDSDANNELLFLFGGVNSTILSFSNAVIKIDLSDGNKLQILTGALTSLPSPRALTSLSSAGNRVFLYGGVVEEQELGDVWQFVNEFYCKSASDDCETCVGYTGCSYCTTNSQPFNCVAGNQTAVYVKGTCSASTTIVSSLDTCPEGFPSWAIALIVIGGVVLIGIIVFAIMKLRSGRSSEYSSLG